MARKDLTLVVSYRRSFVIVRKVIIGKVPLDKLLCIMSEKYESFI